MSKNDEIGIVDIAHVVMSNLRLIILLVILGMMAGFAATKVLPKQYASQADLLLIQAQSAQIGNGVQQLAAIVGASSASNKVMVLLKSRTLSDKVFEQVKYDYYNVYYKDQWDAEKQSFKPESGVDPKNSPGGSVSGFMKFVTAVETGVLLIEAETLDPKFSYRLVNTYVEELRKYLRENTLTEVKRKEQFIGDQLKLNSINVLKEEEALANFYKYNRQLESVNTVDVNIDTPTDSTFRRATVAVKSDGTDAVAYDNGINIVKNIPVDVYLKYLTNHHQILMQINQSLQSSHIISRIETEQKDLWFHIVDSPVVSGGPSKPALRFCVAIGFAFGLVLSIGIVFVKRFYVEYKKAYP